MRGMLHGLAQLAEMHSRTSSVAPLCSSPFERARVRVRVVWCGVVAVPWRWLGGVRVQLNVQVVGFWRGVVFALVRGTGSGKCPFNFPPGLFAPGVVSYSVSDPDGISRPCHCLHHPLTHNAITTNMSESMIAFTSRRAGGRTSFTSRARPAKGPATRAKGTGLLAFQLFGRHALQ